jgi:type IV secretion system protein VirD4
MNSILSVFDNKMSIFSLQPTLLKMLANNDFDIADIGQKKTALFMVIPDEKTTFSALCSLFIKQSYEYLIFTAMQTGHKTVANRVNYCLDEFSALPSIADFPAMITAARSRDIRFLLVVQSQSSLKRKYKEDADTIIGNCTNWIFFTSRELGLLRELSELCGMQRNNLPNISTYELQHLSKDNREALLLCGRYKPAKVAMIDIDNRVFSGASYSVLEMPTGDRMERKSLSFALSPAPSEIPANIMNTREGFVNPFSLGIDHPPTLEKKEPDPPDDSDYSKLVTAVETRISGLVGTESSVAEMMTSDDSPASLEELLKQLQTDE